MIDIEKAKKEFLNYTSQYPKSIKIQHSLRVMEISKFLAEKLNLSEEKIQIATLIGLLHDIGRFEQYEKYKTFKDYKSIDHGDEGVKLLEKDNYIRKYIKTDKYDNIKKIAIKNHNKYEIQKGLNKEEELFSKIIKDADKIDILYEATTMFWENCEEKIKHEEISKQVIEQFENKKLIKNETRKTKVDEIIGVVSYIYDINFVASFEKIKKENYIFDILNKFEYNTQTNKQIEKIKAKVNEYIEEKLK